MLDVAAPETFVELAGRVVVSRVVFAELCDRLVEPLGPQTALPFIALARLRERDNPGLTGRDKDVADFAAVLRQAESFGLLLGFLAQHATQIFGGETAADAALETLKLHPRFVETFNRSLPAVIGEIDALRRTCRIICQVAPDEQERGSGFLIGPHLVLTNYHVVKSLIADGRAKAGSHLSLRVELDALLRSDGRLENVKAFGVVDAWLVDFREAHPQELAGGGDGPNAPWPDKPFELADKLDFAIIELDGAPGYERGWYDLTEEDAPKPGEKFELFQFPLGRAMSHAPGTFELPRVFAFRDAPPRLLHDAPTERGSSGGLCLDGDCHAVALHQADYGSESDGPVRKIAIPLSLIAAVAKQKVADKIASAPRLVATTASGAPVLGRKRLQSLADEMIRGGFRILIVQAGADPAIACGKLGKTFSKQIIRALLPPNNVMFETAAGRLTSDAYEAARALIEAAKAEMPAALASTRPQPPQFTPKDADELAASVIAALRNAAGSCVCWVVIDDLDHFPVQGETTAASFLDAFYRRAAAETDLRVVLIGPAAIPPGLAGLKTRTDVIQEHITDADVEAWITRQFRTLAPLLPEHARILASVIGSLGAAGASDRRIGLTQATATDLLKHWSPFLRAPA